MISTILKHLIQSRGTMTINGPQSPGCVRLDWLASDGKGWRAISHIHDPHNDLEYAMTEVLYHFRKQRYREFVEEIERSRQCRQEKDSQR